MTKLDKDQIAAKRALAKHVKEQQEAEWIKQREEEFAEYRATLPKRMMDAQALANKIGVQTDVKLTESGTVVIFKHDHNGDRYIDTYITYDTDSWEMETLEQQLNEIKAEQDATEDRRLVAQTVFDKLTPEQKVAIKEHIYYLR